MITVISVVIITFALVMITEATDAHAKQAKDPELIALATEIRKRAERRLGELMAAERKAGLLAKGTRHT